MDELTETPGDALEDVDEIAARYHSACEWADLAALRVNLWLIEAHRSLIAGLVRTLDPVEPGMSTARFLTLRDLFLTGGHRLTQADIQRRGKTSSGSVTRLIDGMEQEGLIVRLPRSGDRRTNYIELTPKGLALCQRLIPAVARYSVEVCVAMSDEEKESFVRLLRVLSAGAERVETE